jgi:hypothetical protein
MNVGEVDLGERQPAGEVVEHDPTEADGELAACPRTHGALTR